MEFLMEYHLAGIMIGVATFLIIGIFHPLVTKGEYYFGVRIWWIFLLMGIAAVIGSVLVENIVWSTLLAVWGASSFWSIGELFEQRKRVEKGWFPKRPEKSSGSPSLLVGRFPPQPLLPKLMDAFVREGLRMFLFLGLKNDDDDRRDNQYQARGTVEAELLPEMQHPDEYCRQRLHRTEDRCHRRTDLLDCQNERQVGYDGRHQGQQQEVLPEMPLAGQRSTGREQSVHEEEAGAEKQDIKSLDHRIEPGNTAFFTPTI